MSIVENIQKKRVMGDVMIVKNYCIKPSQVRYLKVTPKNRTILFCLFNNEKIKVSFKRREFHTFIDILYSLTSFYTTSEFNRFVNAIDLGKLGRYY